MGLPGVVAGGAGTGLAVPEGLVVSAEPQTYKLDYFTKKVGREKSQKVRLIDPSLYLRFLGSKPQELKGPHLMSLRCPL